MGTNDGGANVASDMHLGRRSRSKLVGFGGDGPQRRQREGIGRRWPLPSRSKMKYVDAVGYSLAIASSTSSRAARRAGPVAASTPARPAIPDHRQLRRRQRELGDALVVERLDDAPRPADGQDRAEGRPEPAISSDSHRTARRTWRRYMPTARSSPSSRDRSCTDRASVLAIPIGRSLRPAPAARRSGSASGRSGRRSPP